jgi:pimeloyl-ACP methyl ester carboxylesterase
LLQYKVPLDYSEPDGESAVIALIRIPSPFISSGSSDYRGPVIFNPGGPGGDGVNFMLRLGQAFSAIVGPHFDLVTFDPRGKSCGPFSADSDVHLTSLGVGRTTPRVSLYGTDIERALWTQWEWPGLNASTNAIQLAWARAQILGRLAEERDCGGAKHVSTDTVARDMLRITQAYGRDRIQYWGFSYLSLSYLSPTTT